MTANLPPSYAMLNKYCSPFWYHTIACSLGKCTGKSNVWLTPYWVQKHPRSRHGIGPQAVTSFQYKQKETKKNKKRFPANNTTDNWARGSEEFWEETWEEKRKESKWNWHICKSPDVLSHLLLHVYPSSLGAHWFSSYGEGGLRACRHLRYQDWLSEIPRRRRNWYVVHNCSGDTLAPHPTETGASSK